MCHICITLLQSNFYPYSTPTFCAQQLTVCQLDTLLVVAGAWSNSFSYPNIIIVSWLLFIVSKSLGKSISNSLGLTDVLSKGIHNILEFFYRNVSSCIFFCSHVMLHVELLRSCCDTILKFFNNGRCVASQRLSLKSTMKPACKLKLSFFL